MVARTWHPKALASVSTPQAAPPTAAFATGASVGDGEPFSTVATSGSAADLTGTLPAGSLPNPTPSTLGGVKSLASTSHNFLTSIGTDGTPAAAQPAFSDISGSVSASQLPNPSASTLGGVQSYASVSHQWINTISTSGVPASTQPAFTDISGSVASTQLPTPGASTLGGVKSATASAHQFGTGIDTSGNPTFAQPATNDLSQTTGTFTPSISFATPGDIAVTYATQDGIYWIIGNLCFYKIRIATSAFTWSTSSGDFRINGLPFTVKNNSSSRGVGTGSFQGITKVNYTQYTPTCRENTTTMAIVASGSGQNNSNVGTAGVASGGTIQLELSGFYEMA